MDIFIIAAAFIGLSSLFNRVSAYQYTLSTTHKNCVTSPVTVDPSLPPPLPPPPPSSPSPPSPPPPPVSTHNNLRVYSTQCLRQFSSPTLPAPDPSVLSRLAHYGIYREPVHHAPRRRKRQRNRKTKRGTRGGRNRRIHTQTGNRPSSIYPVDEAVINGPDFNNLISIDCNKILIDESKTLNALYYI